MECKMGGGQLKFEMEKAGCIRFIEGRQTVITQYGPTCKDHGGDCHCTPIENCIGVMLLPLSSTSSSPSAAM